MSILRPIALACAGLLLSAPAAAAQEVTPTAHPYLWRIEGEPEHYLYGTIHIADPRVTTLPQIVEDAFYSADAVYTELPFDQDMMAPLGRELFLPAGQSLQELVPADLYARLDAVLKRRGMSMAAFDGFQPWALFLILSSLDFLDAMQGEVLDMYLYNEALVMGMEAGGLETFTEQLDVFRSFSVEDQLHLLGVAVEQFEQADREGKDAAEEMIAAYLAGADSGFDELLEEYRSDDLVQQQLYDRLLTERNQRMADRIDAMLRAAPDQRRFFAVGAAHMPGPQGVVALLRAKGWQVTRLAAPEAAEPASAADVRDELDALREELRAARDELRALREELRRLHQRLDRLERTRLRRAI